MTDLIEIEGALKPSVHERVFDEFLKLHQLHVSQTLCGLGWVERNVSNSGMYRHSVSLDVANESVRAVLPNVMGHRSLFRFMIPSLDGTTPHLTTSEQRLYLPGVQLTLPKNPNLQLDIAALLMLAKSQAQRTLWAHEAQASPSEITLLLALWFGRSARRSVEYDHDFNTGKTESAHAEIAEWIVSGAPAYLTLAKFIHPEQTQELTLDEAHAARGIASHRLAVLYPIDSSKSPF